MRDIKNIVSQYQKGDAEKRLNLFLEHPRLRNDFIQIEQGQVTPSNAGPTPPAANGGGKRKSVFNPCARLLRWCDSLI